MTIKHKVKGKDIQVTEMGMDVLTSPEFLMSPFGMAFSSAMFLGSDKKEKR